VKWITKEGGDIFEFIGNIFRIPLLYLEWLLLNTPWFLVILAIAAIAWRWSNWRLSLGTTVGMFFIGMLGLWAAAMSTLAIVIVATFLAIFIGLPVGIVMSRSDRFEGIMRSILDIMQTMPSFVYLIPTLMLFGLGKVPALISTVIYAIPPVTRLTNLGIRQVPTEMLEAGHAFGSTTWQLLFKVQLPLALPAIMAGINQTVMMALGMVVICSMIGAGGLGDEVLIGINQLKVGRGFSGGISIVILAIIIDRLTQSSMAKQAFSARK
jgi:glycine betaine/proline transport system permease protein